MWHANPDKRPEARHVAMVLDDMEKDYIANPKKWNILLAKAISKQLEKQQLAAAAAAAVAAASEISTSEFLVERDAAVKFKRESYVGPTSPSRPSPLPNLAPERRGSAPQPVAFREDKKEEKDKHRSDSRPAKPKSPRGGEEDKETPEPAIPKSKRDKKKRERASSMMEERPPAEKEKKKDRAKLATISGGPTSPGEDSPTNGLPRDIVEKRKSKERIKSGQLLVSPVNPSSTGDSIDLTVLTGSSFSLGSLLKDK